MDRSVLLAKISSHLADVLDLDDVALTETSNAEQIENWDSINNVRLLISLERDLELEFGPDEAGALDDVGALIDLIQKKQS
jgi:acyl carrier protein